MKTMFANKYLIIALTLFTVLIQAVEYKAEFGISGALPIETGPAMYTNNMLSGGVDYNWDLNLIFYNNLKITSSSSIVLGLSYGYGSIHIEKEYHGKPLEGDIFEDYNYDYYYHKVKVSTMFRSYFAEFIYFNIGIFLDLYLNSVNDLTILPVGGSIGLGFEINNSLGLELSLEGFRRLSLENIMSTSYTSMCLGVFYSF